MNHFTDIVCVILVFYLFPETMRRGGPLFELGAVRVSTRPAVTHRSRRVRSPAACAAATTARSSRRPSTVRCDCCASPGHWPSTGPGPTGTRPKVRARRAPQHRRQRQSPAMGGGVCYRGSAATATVGSSNWWFVGRGGLDVSGRANFLAS